MVQDAAAIFRPRSHGVEEQQHFSHCWPSLAQHAEGHPKDGLGQEAGPEEALPGQATGGNAGSQGDNPIAQGIQPSHDRQSQGSSPRPLGGLAEG